MWPTLIGLFSVVISCQLDEFEWQKGGGIIL